MKSHHSASNKRDIVTVTIIESTISELYNINTPKGIVRYFNNIVGCNTPKLKRISKYLKDKKILRLEDVKKDFDKRFNSKWLNK